MSRIGDPSQSGRTAPKLAAAPPVSDLIDNLVAGIAPGKSRGGKYEGGADGGRESCWFRWLAFRLVFAETLQV